MRHLQTAMCALILLLLCACSASVPLNHGAETQAGTQDISSFPYGYDKVNQINLVLGFSGPDSSLNGYWASQYKQHVEDLSNGKITIDIYSESMLGSDLEMAADCQYGTVDIQITTPAALVTVIPEAAIFDMPFLFKDLTSARAALSGEVFFQYLAEAYEKNGLILLPLTDQGFRDLSISTPIESFDDLKPLTIRCLNNEHHVAFWEALGIHTVSMDIADVYLALQKGGVQGEENPYDQIYHRKFFEVQKYVTNSNHLLYVGAMHISKITWDSLSETSQNILWSAAEECRRLMPEHVDIANAKALAQMNKEGIRLIDFDSIPELREQCRALCQPAAYDSIAAVTGNEILDSWCATAGWTP